MVSRMQILASVVMYFAIASAEQRTVVAPFTTTAPVSAAILGDDGQGHTTYALQQVELDGDHTRAVMTATLVEGADHISYRLDHVSGSENLHLVLDCAISGGNRICSSDPAKALTLPARYMTLDVGNGAPQTGTGNGAPPTPTGSAGHKAAGSILAVVVAAAAQGLMLSW